MPEPLMRSSGISRFRPSPYLKLTLRHGMSVPRGRTSRQSEILINPHLVQATLTAADLYQDLAIFCSSTLLPIPTIMRSNFGESAEVIAECLCWRVIPYQS